MKLVLLVGLHLILVLAQASMHWARSDHPTLLIIGGGEVEPHSIPQQAALYLQVENETYFCGGSILNSRTILTAAHCLNGASTVKVVLGAHNVGEDEETQVKLESTKFTIHPDFNAALLTNDIGVVHLEEEITFNDCIKPVKLPENNKYTYEGDFATVSGWGLTSDANTSLTNVLHAVELPIISNLLCAIFYLGAIEETNICASGADHKSTCYGDTGGPLIVASSGEQIGIASFVFSAGCEIGWPPVFTRVSSYLDWIAENSN